MSTIFLDRDGVINENRADYVKNWQEFRFLPGAKEAIAGLSRAGHDVIICTNQACVARGILAIETLEDIHHRMLVEIAQAGGRIRKVYYCPHAKDAGCLCRKPHPGMLLQARDDLSINMSDALFIGDSITDIRAGLAAGVIPVLLLTGLGREQLRERSNEAGGPFYISRSLMHAVSIILQGLYTPQICTSNTVNWHT